jgi:hypothetical protein
VRLEVADNCSPRMVEFLLQQFGLRDEDLYRVEGPVNLYRLREVPDQVERPPLKYPPFTPGLPQALIAGELFEVLKKQDVLLHHPFQSFLPVVDFIRTSAEDPGVIAIKQTVYRTGTDSELMQILVDAARKGKDQSKAAQAEQQEERARAEVDVYDYRINKSRITAPIGGTIIAGDMKDRIGSTMKTGDLMFQIAALDDIIVTVKVDERDIALVKKSFEKGLANGFKDGYGTGEIASKAKPDVATPFIIERIVPLAAQTKRHLRIRARPNCRPCGNPSSVRSAILRYGPTLRRARARPHDRPPSDQN